jgi:DNA-nicking Smr family endonuclease
MKKPPTLPDHQLWDDVRKTIRPLGRKKSSTTSKAAKAASPSRPSYTSASHAGVRHATPALADFDRRQLQKLSRQREELDARIDLHGETLDSARLKLHRFLEMQRTQGSRLVLVITGKGDSATGRIGRLRREVPFWLEEALFRHHVSAFHKAHQRHGGDGALYVKLRRVTG